MPKQKSMLSEQDRKAVDLVLDHPAVTRINEEVSPLRIAAVTKLLHLLDEFQAADPPANLVSRTMERIDRDIANRAAHPTETALPPSAQLH